MYVLATCATQLLFGRLYTFFDSKATFLGTIVLFEVGSAICGAAPNSTAFIFGRAIAGAGAAGVFAGSIVIMIPLVPLEKRPMYQGFLGAIFGVSSVIGPLVGGAFTNNNHLTWRWCFYINLPIGAVSILLLVLFLRLPPRPKTKLTTMEKFKRMDPLGNLVFTPSIVSLLLAIQWGGSVYAWNSSRIIALLVLAAVLFIAWIVIQAYGKENATVPSRVFLQRSVICAMAFALCVGGAMLVLVYYMAVWFQAVSGVDALESGIRTLPFVLALVAASILSGGLVSRLGYYTPMAIISACVMSVGFGLLTTLKPESGSDRWIGYQFLGGFGMGLGMQMPSIAMQVVLKDADVPIGVSLNFFAQGLGGAVFLCVAQSVFLQELLRRLSVALPAASAQVLAGVGATNLRALVPLEQLPAVLAAYNGAITTTFFVAVGIAACSLLPALGLEWRSVKAKKEEMKRRKAGKTDQSEKKGDKTHDAVEV